MQMAEMCKAGYCLIIENNVVERIMFNISHDVLLISRTKQPTTVSRHEFYDGRSAGVHMKQEVNVVIEVLPHRFARFDKAGQNGPPASCPPDPRPLNTSRYLYLSSSL